ncbi:MAG: LuxR C-terminal-related transcriptional regulator [Aestuariibacter sp.]
MAVLAFLLHLLEQYYGIKRFTTESYIIILTVVFAIIGVWIGFHLASSRSSSPFELNEEALQQLQLTERELQVLQQLALGHSNQEIADNLYVATSTVKTHLNKCFQKLDVTSRTQAIKKARHLSIVP